jgi:glycosyltransferase involved in cell wall biosynthesis
VSEAAKTISAVLAVRDEEDMLEGALRLLGFCDEIVVVIDDRTTDRSAEIARRHADKVVVVRFEDYAQLKNAGVDAASSEWILFCDGDERVTPSLASEVQDVLARDDGTLLALRSPTVNFFWGVRMEHGGWPMRQVKIVRRAHAHHRGAVHEQLAIPEERIGELRGERWHFSHRSVEENLVKAIRYGQLQAASLYAAGAPRVTAWTYVKVMALEFGRRMIRRAGFRDGMPGIIEGIFQPFALFCAEAMLWELQQGDAVRDRYAALERELGS